MEKGFLLDKEMLSLFSGLDEKSLKEIISSLGDLKTGERFITKSFFLKNSDKIKNLIGLGVESRKFFIDLEGVGKKKIEDSEKDKLVVNDQIYVKVLSAPAPAPRKISVLDFVKYFRTRYTQIRKILEEKNLENLSSIRKIGFNRENYTIIAAVISKRFTKNKNLLIEVEDLTGKIAILVNQNREDLFRKAKDLLLDDIVAFQVTGNSEMLFVNNIVYPDAFLKEKRKASDDIWVAFTSDWHIGSKMFLEDNLLRFVKWLNGESGSQEEREVARKIKYLFLTGDNIDGVGVYPEQNKYLKIMDIKDQYKRLAEIMLTIRSDIKLIMAPGQHDGVRVAEPQPVVEEFWSEDLHKVSNLTLVSNPALIEIVGGFKILMYHGASMNSLVNEMEDIRINYGHKSPARVVKELLLRRHLAPTHGSVVYIPDEKEDGLVISQVPDILATGDWHRPDVGNYNGILTIASSCWQSATPFEEKVGNQPDPCKVPLFNLKTREIKIMDFGGNSDEKIENPVISSGELK